MTSATVIKFGTDGWRGIIAKEFTFPNLRRVASATADYIRQQPGEPNTLVLIGFDRRFSSREFASTVASVFRSKGLRVKVSSHPLPTPAVSVCVRDQKASWGIMITASHNPALYNGFKVKDRFGRSAPPEVTREVESRIPSLDPGLLHSPTAHDTFDYWPAYQNYLKSRLDWNALQRYSRPVVFDYLYGSGSGIPERLLKGSDFRLHAIHAEHDPLFGGLHPEPIESNLKDLQREVQKRKASVGIAVDGDADRLGVVDEKGGYLTPHQVFPLLVLHGIEQKGWKGKIVQSVSLGALGERMAAHFNLPFEEVPVGFKHVAERMLREDILAGGEESGGYAVRGGLPERDGILNGLLFIEMLAVRKLSPSKLVADMEKRFGRARFHRVDLTLSRAVEDKDDFVKKVSDRLPAKLQGTAVQDVRTQDGLKVRLAGGAWLLMRPSGTEPLLRTYAESDSWEKTRSLLQWAQKTVKELYGLSRGALHG